MPCQRRVWRRVAQPLRQILGGPPYQAGDQAVVLACKTGLVTAGLDASRVRRRPKTTGS